MLNPSDDCSASISYEVATFFASIRKIVITNKKQYYFSICDKASYTLFKMLKLLLLFFFLGALYCQDINKDVAKAKPCTLDDGNVGECVVDILCRDNKNKSVIDTRAAGGGQGGCGSYLCCKPIEVQKEYVTPKPQAQGMYNQVDRKGCGWRNPNGVGFVTTGVRDGVTKFGEFPWVVAILRMEPVIDSEPNGPKLSIYMGVGSLIHPSVVLTAAHHVAVNSSLRIRAGEWDAQTIKEIYPHQNRRVISKEIHQDFNKETLFYAAALLFLNKPVDMAQNVGVVCLPPPRKTTNGGTGCFAAGWGKDKFSDDARYQTILKKIEVPVVERADCQGALRKTRLGSDFQLHTSFMCAGGEKNKDVCKGDEGSPLSCPLKEDKDRFEQTGIVAWGIDCGNDGAPSVYVDVAYIRTWIDKKVVAYGYDTKTYTI